MNFIIHYDVAAMLITLIVIVHYYLKDRIHTKSSGMFACLMWVHLIGCVLDLTTAIMINHVGALSNEMQYILNGLYCVVVHVNAPIYLGYMIYVTKGIHERWGLKDYAKVWGLFSIEMIMILTTPWTKYVFFFDESRKYYHGSGFDLLYLISVIYYMVALVQAIRCRTALKKDQILMLHIYTVMNVVATMVEAHSDSILVTQFVLAVTILLMYFTLENPEDYSDKKLGIFNRDGFVLRLNGMIDNTEGFRVLGVRVRGLKYVNDEIGVDNHGLLLKEISEFFCHVGGAKNVFRMSNSGFAIFLENSDDAEECLIDAVKNRFATPFYLNETKMLLSAPMAILRYPEDVKTIESVLDSLDYAIHEAVKSDEHVIVRVDEELLNKKRREGQILRNMKEALRDDGFEVFYQPIYSVEKKRYTAAEALIRMPKSDIGFISPEEFIPLAERNGMILEIGEFVFRTVCEFMTKEKLWEKGIENIHVNLSVVQCMQEQLAQNFLDIMNCYELPCNRINLEVTETAAVASSEHLTTNMNALMEKGVQFALDDYGTGFSNATSLIQYPYETIKIDKGVIWAAMKNDNAMKVLTHSVAMIKALHLNIVAEGVETIEQANELMNMGCDYFQGYYYSKPVNAKDFIALLEHNFA